MLSWAKRSWVKLGYAKVSWVRSETLAGKTFFDVAVSEKLQNVTNINLLDVESLNMLCFVTFCCCHELRLPAGYGRDSHYYKAMLHMELEFHVFSYGIIKKTKRKYTNGTWARTPIKLRLPAGYGHHNHYDKAMLHMGLKTRSGFYLNLSAASSRDFVSNWYYSIWTSRCPSRIYEILTGWLRVQHLLFLWQEQLQRPVVVKGEHLGHQG